MSQDRIRLLEHILYQQFGPVVGEVSSILLFRNTLTFIQLARLSSLPPHLIQQALLTLSVHALLYHSESEGPNGLIEHFQLNNERVEERIRIGSWCDSIETKVRAKAKAIKAAQSSSSGRSSSKVKLEEGGFDARGGQDEYEDSEGDGTTTSVLAFVIESIWKEGILSTVDLIERAKQGVRTKFEHELLEREIQNQKDSLRNTANGTGSSSSKSKGKGKAQPTQLTDKQVQQRAVNLLKRAFDDGYISIVTAESQNIPASLEIAWEADAKRGMNAIPSAKEAKELKAKLEAKKEEWYEEQKAKSKAMTLHELRESYARKKKTPAYHEEEPDDEELVEGMKELPNDGVFRINAERFHMDWRSEMMYSFASDIYNPQIGRVFKVILDIVSPSLHSMDQSTSRSTNRTELVRIWELLPASSRCTLRHAFGEDPCIDPSWGSLSSKKDSDFLLEALYVLSKSDDLGLRSTPAFLLQNGEGPNGKWSVCFEDLGKRMKRALVEAVVEDKLDKKAIKCWRILEAKGKLDEKHLARLAFLTVKDARETLARLSALNLIQAQEVPRSADRAPSRTFFLWYVDYPKVITILLDHHYKALANLQVQKINQLKDKKAVIDKRERKDVKENPGLYLTTRDRELIKELDKLLEALNVAETRLDRQIFVLNL